MSSEDYLRGEDGFQHITLLLKAYWPLRFFCVGFHWPSFVGEEGHSSAFSFLLSAATAPTSCPLSTCSMRLLLTMPARSLCLTSSTPCTTAREPLRFGWLNTITHSSEMFSPLIPAPNCSTHCPSSRLCCMASLYPPCSFKSFDFAPYALLSSYGWPRCLTGLKTYIVYFNNTIAA